MELFKILGKIAIDNSEANSALKETASNARGTADTIIKSNQSTQSSNKTAGSSFGNLRSRVAEYKAQGMTTSQAWRQASADMKSSTEGASNGMVSAFKRIGAAVAAYMTVDAIKNFGLGCIQAAADASAMSSQFSQVFGDLEESAGESLTRIADNAGITENRMRGSFTKIAAFAKTTGMDTESALALSERAMIAVADSAAFYDRSLEETTESLQSFLKGNFENDAALGLSCTEVTRNEAANKLYGKSFKDLSEAQKQLTLLQMVEDANAASGALGQAARESDTWTNVTGNLQQAWKDFQAVLGSNVLPTAVGVIKSMVGVVENWTAKLPALVQWCKEHKDIIAGISIVVGAVAAAIGIYTSGLTAASVATTVMTAASSAFAGVMGFITSPITLVVLAIGALAAAFVVAYNRSETFRNFINKLKDGFVDGFNAMKDAAGSVKDKIVGAWDEISARCAPLVSAIKDNLVGAFNDLKEAGQGIKDRFDELKAKFQPVADLLSGALSTAVSNVSDWFDKLSGKVGDLAEGALGWLNNKITEAREAFRTFAEKAGELWDKLEPLVSTIRDNLVEALKNLEGPIQTVKDAFKSVSDTVMNNLLPLIRDTLMPLWEALKPVLSAVAAVLGGVVVTAIGIAVGAINGIVSAISGFATMISGVVEVVANVFNLIVGIFTGDGEKIKEAVTGIGDGIVDVFGGLWDSVSGFVSGFVDGVVGFFEGLWDTLVGHSIVPDTIDGIAGCFGELWGKVSGSVSDFCSNVTSKFTELKDKATEKFGELKDKAVEKFGQLKESASEKWESLKSTVSEKASTLKEKATTAFSNLKDKAVSLASDTKDKASSAWQTLKDKTSSLFGSAKEKATSEFSDLKSKVVENASSAGSQAGEKFDSMKSSISLAVSNARSLAVSAFELIKSNIATYASSALTTVTSKFTAIRDKISEMMEAAKSIVTSAIERIKSAFDISLKLDIKLPHVSVHGGEAPYGIGGKGTLPSFSVEWYKKAYDKAMILNDPTIFGYSAASGKMLGGGDGNGNEVVAGESHLMNLIGQVVESKTAGQNDRIIEILLAILNAITGGNEELLHALLSGQKIVLNEREFARAVRTYA